MKRVSILSVAVTLFLPVFLLFAQGSDGSALEPATTTTTETKTATTTGPLPVADPRVSAGTTTPTVVTPTPKPLPQNTVASPVDSTPPIISTSSSVTETNPEVDDNNNTLLYLGFLVLATFPFGYFIIQSLQKKKTKENKEDKKKCFDIKKILDEKLKEMTDLKGRLEDEAKDKVKETIQGAVVGTVAGNTLILMEKLETEYKRLKKLYEECTIEFGERVFKGTIIENSLSNKDILNKLKIEKTYNSSNWILHDALVDEKQIPEFQKYLADGPWYIHLWEQGKDDVKVVFKDRVFDIKFSDKSTWSEAVSYGKSIGIREEQLNFPID
jgi:flagellar biosynthesis/type III secretory pathway chaperone